MASRRWRRRKNVQTIGLLTAGPPYKVVLLRTRYVSVQTDIEIRIVACVSPANARDLGQWIGAPSHDIFSYFPARCVSSDIRGRPSCSKFASARPLDVDVYLPSFHIPHSLSSMIAMPKPAYLAVAEHSSSSHLVANAVLWPTTPSLTAAPTTRVNVSSSSRKWIFGLILAMSATSGH